MQSTTIKKQAILPRIDGIQGDVEKLRRLGELSLAEFSTEDNFVKAQFYLRRALEGVFHITSADSIFPRRYVGLLRRVPSDIILNLAVLFLSFQ